VSTAALGVQEAPHPGRCLCVWNVVTPSGSGRECGSGKPTVRKAQSPGGCGMTREANAWRPKGDGKTRDSVVGPFAGRLG